MKTKHPLIAFCDSGLKAIHAMRDGKKVRRPPLPENAYYYIKDKSYWYFDGHNHMQIVLDIEGLEPGAAYYWYHLSAQLTVFTDWEIIE